MLCLGIETSCDETALALVRDGKCVESVLATQMDVHALFGGVVPEIASREHYRFLGALYDELMRRTGLTLADVDVVAVTRGPGLLGALLVGVAFAKGLSLAGNKPLIAVNHLHAHLLAVGLEHELLYPLLGLPYPGGVLLDRLAQRGAADAHLFPRPYTQVDNLDFSFSGLKTAALTYLNEHPVLVEEGRRVREAGTDSASPALCDVCASYMLAVAETLSLKMEKAFHRERQKGITGIVVAGGVAANTQVRAAMHVLAEKVGKPLLLPSRFLCTDNAVMIAHAGELLACKGYGQGLAFPAIPRGQKLPDDLGELRAPLHSL